MENNNNEILNCLGHFCLQYSDCIGRFMCHLILKLIIFSKSENVILCFLFKSPRLKIPGSRSMNCYFTQK